MTFMFKARLIPGVKLPAADTCLGFAVDTLLLVGIRERRNPSSKGIEENGGKDKQGRFACFSYHVHVAIATG